MAVIDPEALAEALKGQMLPPLLMIPPLLGARPTGPNGRLRI
jgi:hypothetical protein